MLSIQSLRVGSRLPIFASVISVLMLFSRLRKISAIPKRPMAMGTIPSPSRNSGMSKENRATPVMVSSPTVPRNVPTPAIIRALTIDFSARKMRMVRPRIMREKYSGAPNFRATATRGGARTCRTTMPTVPAMKDPKAAIPRAGPARPCRAIW